MPPRPQRVQPPPQQVQTTPPRVNPGLAGSRWAANPSPPPRPQPQPPPLPQPQSRAESINPPQPQDEARAQRIVAHINAQLRAGTIPNVTRRSSKAIPLATSPMDVHNKYFFATENDTPRFSILCYKENAYRALLGPRLAPYIKKVEAKWPRLNFRQKSWVDRK